MGDAVNVAARMEQTAEPGTVQITEDTYRLVADLFEVEPLGGVELKGKREPVASYRVLGRLDAPWTVRAARRLDAPLVGREREMSVIRAALEGAPEGRGRRRAALRRPRARQEPADRGGQRDLVGAGAGDDRRWDFWRCVPYDTMQPYAQYRRLIRERAGVEETRSPPRRCATKIAATDGGDRPRGVGGAERTGRAGAPRRRAAGRAAPRGRGVPARRRPSSSSARPSRRAAGA